MVGLAWSLHFSDCCSSQALLDQSLAYPALATYRYPLIFSFKASALTRSRYLYNRNTRCFNHTLTTTSLCMASSSSAVVHAQPEHALLLLTSRTSPPFPLMVMLA